MAFDVSPESYDRFMGRFSGPLATSFADFAGVHGGQRVVDVGSGPGALTAELAGRLGEDRVAAVEPSEPFLDAVRRRLPRVEAHRGAAESLPFDDGAFDAALAQLVVHFLADPVAGLREMGRVTRAGGTVAACVWDHAGGSGPLSTFWAAARELDPGVPDESGLAGAREGHLAELCKAAGLAAPASTTLAVAVRFASIEEWWEPFTLGVGPAGDHVAALDEPGRAELRSRCVELLPEPPFSLSASAWAVRVTVDR